MMKWLPTVAKAITAVLVIVIAAIADGTLGLDPVWSTVLSAMVAGLAVWAVPNTPEEE